MSSWVKLLLKRILLRCASSVSFGMLSFLWGENRTWYPNQIPNHGAPKCQVTVRWTFQVHVALVCLSYFGATGLSFTNHLVFQRLNHQGCLQDLAAASFHQGRRQGLLGGWCWEQQSHHSMSLGKDVVLYLHIDHHSIIWHEYIYIYILLTGVMGVPEQHRHINNPETLVLQLF